MQVTRFNSARVFPLENARKATNHGVSVQVKKIKVIQKTISQSNRFHDSLASESHFGITMQTRGRVPLSKCVFRLHAR
jgi:hypothetical protein